MSVKNPKRSLLDRRSILKMLGASIVGVLGIAKGLIILPKTTPITLASNKHVLM